MSGWNSLYCSPLQNGRGSTKVLGTTSLVLVMNLLLIKILFLLCVIFLSTNSQSVTKNPEFSEYPVAERTVKTTKKPKIISTQDHEFQAKIMIASDQMPNFAGHYILSTFGCGASCTMTFVIDKKTGKVIWLPFTVCCWDNMDADFNPVSFRKNSRLIIITGSRNEQGKGIYYYEFKQNKFILIHQVE